MDSSWFSASRVREEYIRYGNKMTDQISPTIIDRDASAQVLAIRLQKLRAISLLLEGMEQSGSAHVYCAIENGGDAVVVMSDHEKTAEYSEENKNYDEESAFSFASHAVLNSMVIFVDSWLKRLASPNLFFGFYSTNGIKKERLAGRAVALAISLPDKPILELLRDRNLDYPGLLPAVQAFVLNEYQSQYAGKASSGHLVEIQGWTQENWKGFLLKISWQLGQADEATVEADVLLRLRQSQHFDQTLSGKESLILSAFMDEIERAVKNHDPTERFVHSAQLRCILSELRTGVYKKLDPTWKAWDDLPPPSDTRNLKEKLHDTSETIDKLLIESLSRKAAKGAYELNEYKDDKSFRALRYQIYDICFDKLIPVVERHKTKPLSDTEISACIEELMLAVNAHLSDKLKDFTYVIRNEDSLRGLLLNLFDSCYLAFDRLKTNGN